MYISLLLGKKRDTRRKIRKEKNNNKEYKITMIAHIFQKRESCIILYFCKILFFIYFFYLARFKTRPYASLDLGKLRQPHLSIRNQLEDCIHRRLHLFPLCQHHIFVHVSRLCVSFEVCFNPFTGDGSPKFMGSFRNGGDLNTEQTFYH